MNAPGLPWSKTISIYEARDSHCWNMPTQIRLNSPVAQQTRVCYLSVSLSRRWKIICWRKQEQWRFLQGLSSKVNKSPSSTQKQPPFLLIRVGKTQTAPARASTALELKNKQAARKEQEKTKKKPLSRLTSSLFSLCRGDRSPNLLSLRTQLWRCAGHPLVCGFVLAPYCHGRGSNKRVLRAKLNWTPL